MIISYKQILQLIELVGMFARDEQSTRYATQDIAAKLLDEITNQQSEELKEIKND